MERYHAARRIPERKQYRETWYEEPPRRAVPGDAVQRRPQNGGMRGRPQYAPDSGRTRQAAPQRRNRNPGRSGSPGKMRRRHRRNRAIKKLCTFMIELVLCIGIIMAVRGMGRTSAKPQDTSTYAHIAPEIYPEELVELLEHNEEALDYVECYPDREAYQSQPVDLTGDFRIGEVPLLIQWDKRWGYDAYGNDMIGLAGCGPVCMDMAYLYFTEDTGMTPREMAAFAYDNGYCVEGGGTDWSFWTNGARQLGLAGEELPLDENRMRQALDAGGLIVCSMRPGDFTTTGHFILIRGYDENGFHVNDPNRRSNSERQWDFDTLSPQIKNLWSLGH